MKRLSQFGEEPATKRLKFNADILRDMMSTYADIESIPLSVESKLALRHLVTVLSQSFSNRSSVELRNMLIECCAVFEKSLNDEDLVKGLSLIDISLAEQATKTNLVHSMRTLFETSEDISLGQTDDTFYRNPTDLNSDIERVLLRYYSIERVAGLLETILATVRGKSLESVENSLMVHLDYNSDATRDVLTAIRLHGTVLTAGYHGTSPLQMLDLSEIYYDQEQRKSVLVSTTSGNEDLHEVCRETYDEIILPPPTRETVVSSELPISALPSWTQPCFEGVENLNHIQSDVYPVVFGEYTENVLVCAPTGAGKTNIAMLAILNVIGMFTQGDRIDCNAFKVVYVAPMKALVQEIVRSFSHRLRSLNIAVHELSGDSSLSRSEMRKCQVIVTTPEKWDIVTRKHHPELDKVRLVIIDEIHLLNDLRGPVLEAIIARYLYKIHCLGGAFTRLLGISATLPNFVDVAKFLRVDVSRGLFHYGPSYRPVLLRKTFIGVAQTNKFSISVRNALIDKIKEHCNDGQILVFVHSRQDAENTAAEIFETAMASDEIGRVLGKPDHAVAEILKVESERLKSKCLKSLLHYGIGFHHAGLVKSDRTCVEDLFADRHLKIIVCTSTLAWGVNLPAHTVIIKGTKVYKSESGDWCDLSPLDMLQMLGRAGRPQYDTEGHGIVITSKADLRLAVHLANCKDSIESHLLTQLPEILNAEVCLGSISSLRDAVKWFAYTFYSTRMASSTDFYGVNCAVQQRRLEIVHAALSRLHRDGMIRYDDRSGILQGVGLGAVASYYFLRSETFAAFLQNLRGHFSDMQLLSVLASAKEFSQMRVRDDECHELQKLADQVPYPLILVQGKPTVESKVSILLQAFIGNISLESSSLSSDTAFIQQNAARLMRALLEISLRKGWGRLARIILSWCKSIHRRMWCVQSPLRQALTGIPLEAVSRLEKKGLRWNEYRSLTPQELADVIRAPKLGKVIFKAIHQVPHVDITVSVRPVSSACIEAELRVCTSLEDPVIQMWIFIEDSSQDKLIYFDKKSLADSKNTLVTCLLPLADPLQPHYFVRCCFDCWIIPDIMINIPLADLIQPITTPTWPPTEMFNREMLISEALPPNLSQRFEKLGIRCLSRMQSRVWHETASDLSILLSAPCRSGKFVMSLILANRVLASKYKLHVAIIIPDAEVFRWRNGETVSFLGDSVNIAYSSSEISITGPQTYTVATAASWGIFVRTQSNLSLMVRDCVIVVDGIEYVGSQSIAAAELDFLLSTMLLQCSRSGNKLQTIVTTASASNLRDISTWLGISSREVMSFSDEARLIPVDVILECLEGIEDPAVEELCRFGLLRATDLAASVGAPAILAVPAEARILDVARYLMASTRLGLDVLADIDLPHGFLGDSLRKGLGFLTDDDNENALIRRLFESGQMKILLLHTSDLLKQLWISRVTLMVYRPGSSSFTSELNSLHRCTGRLGLDASGSSVVVCGKSSREKLTRCISGRLQMESHLDEYLEDILNILICGFSGIFTRQDLVDFLTWSFYFKRVLANPSYYGALGQDTDNISIHISNVIESHLEKLMKSGFTAEGRSSELVSLKNGMIAYAHGIRVRTVSWLKRVSSGVIRKKAIVAILCEAAGMEGLQFTSHELMRLSKIARLVSEKSKENPILDLALRLAECLVDIQASQSSLKPTLATIELVSSLRAGLDPGSSPLLQIPGFSADLCTVAEQRFLVRDVLDVVLLGDDARAELLLGFEEEAMSMVAEYCNSFPSLELHGSIKRHHGDRFAVVTVARDSASTTHESWWILVADEASVLSIQKISLYEGENQFRLAISPQEAVDSTNLRVYLMSGSFVGCDLEESIS